MTDKQRQITAMIGKALLRHGFWGAVVAALLLNPQILIAASDAVKNRTASKIAAAEERAVTRADVKAREYVRAETESIRKQLDTLSVDVTHARAEVREMAGDMKSVNRQIGELVGELRARRNL